MLNNIGWSKTRGFVYISIAFCLAHLQGIPQIILFALRDINSVEPSVKTCYAEFSPPWLQTAYILYTFFMQFLIPLVIIIVSYASISVRVLNSIKNKTTGAASDHQDATTRKSTIFRNGDGLIKNDPKEMIRLMDERETFSTSFSNATSDFGGGGGGGGNKSPNKKYSLTATKGGNNNVEFRQHCSKNFSKSKMKTIKLTLTVIVLYIICSTPYFVGLIMNLLLDSRTMGFILSN